MMCVDDRPGPMAEMSSGDELCGGEQTRTWSAQTLHTAETEQFPRLTQRLDYNIDTVVIERVPFNKTNTSTKPSLPRYTDAV